jgi:OmpA-OmpF porin, OOP family
MKSLLITFLLLISASAFGQSRSFYIYKADDYFGKQDYYNALLNYKLAINDTSTVDLRVIPYETEQSTQSLTNKERETGRDKSVSMLDYVNHQIAVCYQETKDYPHALGQYELSAQSGAYPEDYYGLGVAQMNENRHKDAIVSFERFVQTPGHSDSLHTLALESMTGCLYAMDSMNVRREMKVAMADSTFNRGTASFAPMYYDNFKRMVFTSAREGGVVLDPEKQQSEYLCDLYHIEQTGDGWSQPVNFGRPLNSAQHDASGSFNPTNAIFYTRWSAERPDVQNIYLARMIDYRFFESYKLDSAVNYPGYKSINPFVSLDGTTLFFSSDRPGGKGGMDIWKVALDEQGNVTGKPVNLGEPVNSEANEVTPYMHEASSTLFFSSDGHYSIGGLDVFKSAFNRDNETYAIPVNMGMPVNSVKDDAYFVWDRYMNKGYFSSDREDCPSNHCYDIYEVTNAPIKIILDGYVYDAETEEIIPGANLTFKDVRSTFPTFTAKTDGNGYYKTEIQQYWEVFIKAQKPKYFADATNIDARNITENAHLTHDFYLRPIPTDEIVIDGIEYDFDSDKLRPASTAILDELYNFLLLNDNLVVEINSHTDHVGPDIYNLDLSQRRAKSCVNYLISKGIAKERIFPVGYGETQPNFLADEKKNPVLDAQGNRILLTEAFIVKHSKEKQAEYTQRNRRTSFKVVNEEYMRNEP